MSKVIFVHKGGQQTGPYDPNEIRGSLENGNFTLNDLAWCNGMVDWKPIRTFFSMDEGSAAGINANGSINLGDLNALARPCPKCGARLPLLAANCTQCRAATGFAGQGAGGEKQYGAGVRMLIPVNRSGWAIAAGYLGLFSLIIFPAPIALLVSVVAIRDLKKSTSDGEKKYGMGRAIFGLVMGIMGTLVLAWIFLHRLIS